MHYDDVTIRVRSGEGEGYGVEILASPYGAASSVLAPPFTPEEMDALFQVIDRRGLLHGNEPARIVGFAGEGAGSLWLDPKKTGEVLFDALFSGEVGRVFDESLAYVRGRGDRGLRVRLGFDPRDPKLSRLAALPWELTYSARMGDFLGCHREITLVRYVDVPRPFPPLEVAGKLRVLMVVSAPENVIPLEVAREAERVWTALGKGSDERFEVHSLIHPSVEALRDLLLAEPWHVVHFMGHGGFDRDTGQGLLYFEASESRSHGVAGLMFVDHLKAIESLRLVVLNACSAGTLPRKEGQSPFNSIAPALLRAGVPAVIAMQSPILDPCALALSGAFYKRLAAGDPVDAAMVEGRLAIQRTREESLEWASPLLFLGSQGGTIVSRVESKVQLPRPWRSSRPEVPQTIGIRSIIGWPVEAEEVLELDQYFDGREIKDPALWQTKVFPEVEHFLSQFDSGSQPLLLDFAAHSSIAFAAGYCLEAKSGLDITVRQRSQEGKDEWKAVGGPLPDAPLWREEAEREGTAGAPDTAFAIGISRVVMPKVEEYLQKTGVTVSRIIPFTLAPMPAGNGVKNGTHALHLAQSVGFRIESRTLDESEGVLHLFASAPNGFLFFLGQLSRFFGTIQLYEFNRQRRPAYSPSMLLPPPKA